MKGIHSTIPILQSALFILGAALLAIFSGPSASSAGYWTRIIHEHGAKEAYALFATSIENLPITKQHAQAHVFGESVYNSEGLSGLTICGAMFNYGCAHEVMARAIAREGWSAVDVASTFCNQSEGPGNCLHGLGHSLQAYIGYSETDLQKAVSLCALTSPGKFSWGCLSGAFMEYNVRSMADNVVRTPDRKKIIAPCDVFEGATQQICVYELPDWWSKSLFAKDTDTSSLFKHLGESCGTLNAKLQKACFGGIGYVAVEKMQNESQPSFAQAENFCTESSVVPVFKSLCSICASKSVDAALLGQVETGSKCKGLVGRDLEMCTHSRCLDIDFD